MNKKITTTTIINIKTKSKVFNAHATFATYVRMYF